MAPLGSVSEPLPLLKLSLLPTSFYDLYMISSAFKNMVSSVSLVNLNLGDLLLLPILSL